MRQTSLKKTALPIALTLSGAAVLLVDDDAADLEYHYELLQGMGHRVVVSCSSYQQGADLVERGDFDLVVVSQGSRTFEGRVVVERATSAGRHIPVIVLATCADMKCYLEAMQLGAFDYLEKPISAAELRRAVATCLRLALPDNQPSRRVA